MAKLCNLSYFFLQFLLEIKVAGVQTIFFVTARIAGVKSSSALHKSCDRPSGASCRKEQLIVNS